MKTNGVTDLLIVKFFMGETSPAEAAAIRDWVLENEEHKARFQKLFDGYAATTLATARIQGLPEGIFQKRKTQSRRRRILAWAGSIAASLAIGVGLHYFLAYRPLESNLAEAVTVSTAPGQRSTVLLADGTEVILNSGSTLSYPSAFTGGERRVSLSGEALFRVTPDKDKPFLVETFALDVKVLGTEFDLWADEEGDQFKAHLLKGSIALIDKQDQEVGRLAPGETATLKGGRILKGKASGDDDTAWTEGIISFNGASFEEMMRRFERAFGVRIVIERSPAPRNVYSSGRLRVSDGLEHAFEVMRLGDSFRWDYDDASRTYYIR